MSWHEHVQAIASSDLVLSMRYHTTLLSYIAGTPLIDITHHDKNKYFLIENDLTQHSHDYYSISVESLNQLKNMCFERIGAKK